MFRPSKCRCLPLYAEGVAWSRRWLVESATQRRRQRGNVPEPGAAGSPRAIPSLRLGEYLDPFNSAVQSFTEEARALFLQQTGDPVVSQELAWQALQNLRQQQASALAYFDCFWVFAMLMLALVPVVLLMKRSVAEKGARVGGE